MKYEHVYLKLDGQSYYDYTLYTDIKVMRGWYDTVCPKPKDYTFISHDTVFNELFNTVANTNSVKPARGSSLYITPGCKYALDDVRKHYTIKRCFDTGDYNVVVPPKWYKPSHSRITIKPYTLVISTVNKAIIAFYSNQSPIITEELVPGYMPDNNLLVYDKTDVVLQFTDIAPVYKAILDGTVKKPVVSEDNIDIVANTELTIDALLLIYHSANNRNVGWKERRENTILQIKALNQHNWQEYLGTVSLLLGRILNDGGVVSDMIKKPSTLPKEVKNIISYYSKCSYGFYPVSEKDFLFCQKFIKNLLSIDDVQFATYTDVYQKLNKYNISKVQFSSLFNPIVRITSKAYEDFKKAEM